MDLSEYYSEVQARAQADIQSDMKDRIDAYMQAIGR
jgi:conjugal transfer mating pair stabilization protein TraN